MLQPATYGFCPDFMSQEVLRHLGSHSIARQRYSAIGTVSQRVKGLQHFAPKHLSRANFFRLQYKRARCS